MNLEFEVILQTKLTLPKNAMLNKKKTKGPCLTTNWKDKPTDSVLDPFFIEPLDVLFTNSNKCIYILWPITFKNLFYSHLK